MPAASPTGRVEGARRAAPDVVDRCLHRPTPSKHPYRPFAARLEAAADRHRVASTATRLLRGYYESYYEATTRATTRLLQGFNEATTNEATMRSTTGLLRVHYEASTTRLQRGPYVATTRLLRGYYEATTWLLRGYYQATKPANSGVHARHTSLSSRVCVVGVHASL